MKKIILGLLFFTSIISFGQVNIETVFEGGTTDAQNFLRSYFNPVPTGFGYGLNSSWYTTAKAHKTLGFDVRVIASAALVPKSDETFTFNNADFTNIKLADNSLSSAELPSIFGSQKLEDRPSLRFSNGASSSTLPGAGVKEATNYNAVPSAMVQLGLGLFKNTDVKIRFFPKVAQSDFEFSTLGIGIMHDLKQWVPFLKKLPIDISGIVAWNKVESTFFLDSDNPSSDQAIEFNTNTYLFQLIGSKKFSILTIYGGLGVSSFKSNVSVLGTYETDNQTFVDPIALNYDDSSFRGNLGINLKLLFLNLSAEYALQKYHTVSATVGFSIR